MERKKLEEIKSVHKFEDHFKVILLQHKIVNLYDS